MTDNTPGIPLGSWLAELSDERLIRLLELRPDLAQPPPGSIAALAARAARQSIKAATDDLDFLRLAVLDALLVLQADVQPVPTAKLLALIGERAAETEILDACGSASWCGATARCRSPRTRAAACRGIRARSSSRTPRAAPSRSRR